MMEYIAVSTPALFILEKFQIIDWSPKEKLEGEFCWEFFLLFKKYLVKWGQVD